MSTHLTDDRRHLLARAAEEVLALGLEGRWTWRGNMKHSAPWLSTQGSGWMTVMDFTRKGMSGAQPRFPHRWPGERHTFMEKADTPGLPVFEVCPAATDRNDPRVYRHDITGIRNPVATYLAAVDAETVLALVTELALLREQLGVAA